MEKVLITSGPDLAVDTLRSKNDRCLLFKYLICTYLLFRFYLTFPESFVFGHYFNAVLSVLF